MTVSPLDLLILLGSAQGIILAFLLWHNPKGSRLPNRLLAILMVLLASACLAVGIPVANQWISLMLDLFPWIIIMPFGPIILFYTKALLDPSFQIGRKERLHFLPILVDLGSSIIGWTFIIGVLADLVNYDDHQWWGNLIDDYNIYADIPRWLSVTTYLWLSQRFIVQKEKANLLEETQQPHVRWLKPFLRVWFGFQFIWLLFLIPYELPAFRNTLLDNVGWYPIYIPLAGLIYWMGLRGYLHTLPALATPAFLAKDRKVTNTPLPTETVQAAIQSLQRAMEEEKLYLDTELTVEKVGRQLGLPAKTISAVLNQHVGKSFNTYVNEYRIEEVKRRLLMPASQSSTLVGIAFDCGFNSQATFQRAFRNLTNQSPKEFLESQLPTEKTTLNS
ncbi:MAG: helix-turn-helix transcriptional regulator [Bacteroidota bacterium]